MIVRTLLGLLATCLVAALIWCSLARLPAELATASTMLGERWYSLRLEGTQVGFYRARASRTRSGAWLFATELRFALGDGAPVAVTESYRFAASAPYTLEAAEHRVRRDEDEDSVSVTQEGAQLLARRRSADRDLPTEPISWRYTLSDYLAFETWLREQQPPVGASLALKSPKLEQLELISEQLVLDSVEGGRYRVRKRAAPGDTLIELDAQLLPVRLQLAGLFELERTDRATALAARTPLKRASYRLPLSDRLPRHTQLAQLRLRAVGSGAPEFPDPLVLTANPVLPAADGSYLKATLALPVDHPDVTALIASLGLRQLPPRQRLEKLVRYVHNRLRYDRSVSFRPVLTLLEDPRGDCTEFADLLTTLARAAGLPARTVIGMAYEDGAQPALAFHAWNQVQVDGRWQAVDPTWNQLKVDATHWPLPADERRALLLLTGSLEVRLQVLDFAYAEDGIEA
ncbi:MAG: transglutaminase-like domain-containing protein [Pseudomonadota bacterium]